VLFVAALSCYDLFMEEDPTKNRMEDSVELFQVRAYMSCISAIAHLNITH